MTRFQRIRLIVATGLLIGMIVTFVRVDLTPTVHHLNFAPARTP